MFAGKNLNPSGRVADAANWLPWGRGSLGFRGLRYLSGRAVPSSGGCSPCAEVPAERALLPGAGPGPTPRVLGCGVGKWRLPSRGEDFLTCGGLGRTCGALGGDLMWGLRRLAWRGKFGGDHLQEGAFAG